MMRFLVSEPSHASLVLLNERLAILGRVGGLGEEHALVSLLFFLLAHAAWLLTLVSSYDSVDG